MNINFFRSSSAESGPQSVPASPRKPAVENPQKASQVERDEKEFKYQKAIEESDKSYGDEIAEVEKKFQEDVKNVGPGKIEELKLKKDKLQEALREGSIKARQNLEEAFSTYMKAKQDREGQD